MLYLKTLTSFLEQHLPNDLLGIILEYRGFRPNTCLNFISQEGDYRFRVSHCFIISWKESMFRSDRLQKSFYKLAYVCEYDCSFICSDTNMHDDLLSLIKQQPNPFSHIQDHYYFSDQDPCFYSQIDTLRTFPKDIEKSRSIRALSGRIIRSVILDIEQ